MTLQFTHADVNTTGTYRLDWTLASGGPVIHSQSFPALGVNQVPNTTPQAYAVGAQRPTGQPLGQSYKVTLTAIRNGQEATSAPSTAFEIDAPLSAPANVVILDPLV